MKNPLKRKSHELEAMRDISKDVDEASFVPYACHLDPHTLLTKNGELMQTIKLTGFSYENIGEDAAELRGLIRETLRDVILSTDYALWLHTIRRKTSLAPKGKYDNPFSKALHDAWVTEHDWKHKYTNEVYITVVKEGQNAKLTNVATFFRSLTNVLEKRARWNFLERAREELFDICSQIHKRLERVGAHHLGLVEKDGVVISEPATFLNKLTSLIDDPRPLPPAGLADYLTDHELTFGFNAVEVRDAAGTRRFGALLTIKEYHELAIQSLDVLLQLPVEFVITQTLDFINHKKALSGYRDQREVLGMLADNPLPEIIGLVDIIKSGRGMAVDFGEQQISCFVLADSVRELEQGVKTINRAFDELGIIAIREDIRFQEGYWSQLPGNFEFLRRLMPINVNRIAGYCSINNLPAGLRSGSIWGPPVSVFYTAAMTPYFFNFHVGDNGHTLLIGPRNSGKTVHLNFLLSEASKLNYRLCYFDQENHAEIFIRAMGGDYMKIDRDIGEPLTAMDKLLPRVPCLNPLQLDDTPQNRSFLLIWLDTLVRADPYYRDGMSEEFQPFFARALEYVYAQPKEERYLGKLMEHLTVEAPKVATKMNLWYKQGDLAHWFDHRKDTLDLSNGKIGLDLSACLYTPRVLPAVFSYLIHRVISMLDGSPTILVLDEAWTLLDNPIFAARLGNWMQMLKARNAMVILATEKENDALLSQLTPVMMEHIASQFYLPNRTFDDDGYQEVFGLTERECRFIRMIDPVRRQFLLKRGREAIVAQMDLSRLTPFVSMLSARSPSLERMRKLMLAHGTDPAVWVPKLLEQEAAPPVETKGGASVNAA